MEKYKNQKILVLQGLPGSGKTTWALEFIKNNKNFVRINRDSIREQLGREYSKDLERVVKNIRDASIVTSLTNGFSVIVDDTNLDLSNIDQITFLRDEIDRDIIIEVKPFIVPLEECLARNERRVNKIPAKVIVDMWKKYIKPFLPTEEHPQYYPHKEGLSNIWIFDMDGTLALKHPDRSIYEYHKVELDFLHEPVARFAHILAERWNIIILSGREETCREKTINWLNKYHIPFNKILMRKAKDYRADHIIKKEIWEEHIKDQYNVLGVFDDRARVVEMWRNIGLFVCQVAPGDF